MARLFIDNLDAGLELECVSSIQVGSHLQCVNVWWVVVWNSGMRRLVRQLKDSHQDRFNTEHLGSVQSLLDENGFWLHVDVLVTIEKVPT